MACGRDMHIQRWSAIRLASDCQPPSNAHAIATTKQYECQCRMMIVTVWLCGCVRGRPSLPLSYRCVRVYFIRFAHVLWIVSIRWRFRDASHRHKHTLCGIWTGISRWDDGGHPYDCRSCVCFSDCTCIQSSMSRFEIRSMRLTCQLSDRV